MNAPIKNDAFGQDEVFPIEGMTLRLMRAAGRAGDRECPPSKVGGGQPRDRNRVRRVRRASRFAGSSRGNQRRGICRP